MCKTVSFVLVGLSLLLPACKSASREAESVESADIVESARPAALPTRQESVAAADSRAMAPAPEPARPVEPTSAPIGDVAQGSGAYIAAAVARQDKEKASSVRGDAQSGEAYHDWGRNPWIDTAKDHLSTFAADVDTASYTIARRKLHEGTLPPPASVRVEEFVNYFRYAFPEPAGDTPFAVVMDAAPSPLSPGRHILRVGVATKAVPPSERKPAHLVFLVDVSGSMASPDKLDLAKQSLRILTNNLKDGDTVSLVTYAGSSRVVLPPTGLGHKAVILAAIDELTSGGSTAMGSGIDLAYQQAIQGLVPGAISRVIVCSDGDANVGSHTHDEMLQIIAGRAKEGVTLSTIGFGMGNYKDALMEQLADKGNGNSFYIDSLSAAKKVFQEQLGSTLEVVAKDVKLQVDFDPSLVSRYRLVGYENRDVELTNKAKLTNAPFGGVRIRHKQPRGERATEAAFPMVGGAAASFANAPVDLRFAVAVAAFADVLRNGQDAEHWSLSQIRDLVKVAAGDDADRKELVGLIDRAIRLRSSDRHARR
jgi:Ca-activated chloride channel family protein